MRSDVEAFLNGVGLTIVSETPTEVVLYCPFHNNVDTPSFSINKKTGLWQCFNPSCGRKGRFATLSKLLKGKEEELRDRSTYDEIIGSWESDSARGGMSLDNVRIDYDVEDDIKNLCYLLDRGFEISTLRYFEIGFSKIRKRIVIPVRDLTYKVVGFIGRAIDNDEPLRYQYSKGFARRDVLFHLQNITDFDSVIITEGSLDAMKVFQSGHQNVVASLGAQFTDQQATLVNKYFDSIVIFADNDLAGAGLRDAIIDKCPRKGIKVVEYPTGIKDPGEMNEDQIRQCIDNAIDPIEYIFQ